MKTIGTAFTIRTDQATAIAKATRALGFKHQAAFVRYAIDGELARLGYTISPASGSPEPAKGTGKPAPATRATGGSERVSGVPALGRHVSRG